VSTTLPLLPPILKLLSACYIIFLAIKLWHTANQEVELNQPTIRARELFCATLLNPKALLFASAIFPVAAWSNFHIYLVHMMAYLALITPIALFWIFLGSVLASKKVGWLNQTNLQKTASLVLVSFSIPISYSALLNL
jgi:threonine/homoserine/homoserine lactone efflux protein